MKVSIIKDYIMARELWEKHSPSEILWDRWEVCSCFSDNVHFLLFEKDGKEGLLPLSFDDIKKEYTQFGGTYPENRKFWFPLEWFDEVLECLPKPLKLFELNADNIKNVLALFPNLSHYFMEDDPRYILTETMEVYLSRFNRKHKYNLFYDIKKNIHLKLEWSQDYNSCLETFNIDRFGDESDFNDQGFVASFRNFINYLKSIKALHTLIVKDKEKIIGVEIAALYKDCYYVLNSGYDSSYSSVGKLMTYEHIKKGISLGKKLDFLTGGEWKKLWNFDVVKQYKFKN